MSKTVLKPCPFCGGKAEIIYQPWPGDRHYAATCVTAGCMAAIFPFATEEQAARKWNRRVENSDV